jgi:dolichyl-phosphate-mannose--protein O-mannosyl transferase
MRKRFRAAAVPAGLVALLVTTRLPRLDRPRALVFDELYYALDAADLLRHGAEAAAAHPPLGKWLIAGGIQVLGFTPWGWRLAPLVAGAAVVVLTWLAARRVTDDPWLAALAGGLVVFDGIAFVTGRLALLDGLAAVATTGAAWCLLAALRDRGDARRLRSWRWATAAFLGLGTAIKWSVVWTWPVAALVLVALERRLAPPGPPRRRTVLRAALTLTVVPAALYLASFTPWLLQAEQTRSGLDVCDGEDPCHLGPAERVEALVDHHHDLLDFHTDLEPDNPQAAPAWTWVFQSDAANLFDKPCRPEMAQAPDHLSDRVCSDRDEPTTVQVLVVANPVGWVASMLALVGLLVATVRRRDDAAGVVVALAAAQWVPWLLGGREVYSYYAVTLVPVLAVGVAAALDRYPPVRRWTLLPLAIGVVVAFVWLYPALSGMAT